MAKKLTALRQKQLDGTFADLESVREYFHTPKRGWLKEIREALGMSMQDVAARLGVVKQRIERIEKDEVAGKVTLETMSKMAQSMECDFVYFLIPKNGNMTSTLEAQAKKVATSIANSVDASMKLEQQGTSEQAKNNLIESIAKELLSKRDRKLWK